MNIDANHVVQVAQVIANCDFRVTVSRYVTGDGYPWHINVGESNWTRMLVVKEIDHCGQGAVLDLVDSSGKVERTITLKDLVSSGYSYAKQVLRTDENNVDEKRKGEIALKLLESMMMKRQMPAPNDFMRELGNVAKDIGEETETLKRFYEALLPKMIGRMLGRKSVSLTTSD